MVLTACAIAVADQALGQAPTPPVPPQSKKRNVSKPVRLNPPPAKPRQATKPVPPAGPAVKPKSPPKPALKSFLRKTQKLNLIGGDQVLLIGDGLVEQAQKQGYLEYRITVQNSGKKLHFHNIGWSGDTPAGIARDGLGTRQAGHEPANEGWLQLSKQITDIKPTVAIIGYGMASSLDDSTLEQFKSDYQRLVGHIKASAGKKNRLRLVFMSPIVHEDLGGKLPNGQAHNESLEKYREAIGDLATEHDAWFVDLYRYLRRRKGSPTPPLTTDGIHLSDYGYWVMASAAEYSFSWLPSNFRFGIMDDGTERGGGYGIKLANLSQIANGVTLDGQFEGLPPYFAREKKGNLFTQQTAIGRIQFLGLPEGRYTLAADNVEILTADTKEWASGAFIDAGLDIDQAEEIRRLIMEKNELFFHRSRPQNKSYIWVFRKHEQGNIFRELPMFDPLIRQK